MSSPNATSPVVQRLLAAFPGSSASVPSFPQSTPKSGRNSRVKKSPSSSSQTPRTEKRHTPTNKQCFASGSFSDSPSANSVPPPPTTWVLEESVDLDQSGSESDVSCSTDSSSSSRDEMKTPVYGGEVGFRVNPLQLIAAVTSA